MHMNINDGWGMVNSITVALIRYRVSPCSYGNVYTDNWLKQLN